jgi:hypothetical protein
MHRVCCRDRVVRWRRVSLGERTCLHGSEYRSGTNVLAGDRHCIGRRDRARREERGGSLRGRVGRRRSGRCRGGRLGVAGGKCAWGCSRSERRSGAEESNDADQQRHANDSDRGRTDTCDPRSRARRTQPLGVQRRLMVGWLTLSALHPGLPPRSVWLRSDRSVSRLGRPPWDVVTQSTVPRGPTPGPMGSGASHASKMKDRS